MLNLETPPKQLFMAGIVLVVVLFTSFAGFYLGKTSALRTVPASVSPMNSQAGGKNCETALVDTQEELTYCYNDMAKVSPETQEPYDFSTFGVYSPLLKDKIVHVTTFTYKKTQVVGKTVHLSETDSSQGSIVVWIAKNATSMADFPTFGGYENYGTPVWVSEIAKNWIAKNRYASKAGLKFNFTVDYAPKSIGSVSLDMYSTFSPAGGPIFVQVSAPVSNYPLVDNLNAPEVKQAHQRAKEIADTIQIKL